VRVTPDLVVLDTVYICNQPGGQNLPAVAFNGENYLVVWYDPGLGKGMIACRVTPQGAVLDTGNCLGSGDDDPDIATLGDHGLVVWSRDYYGVCARFLDRQAQPMDTVMLVAPIAASGTTPRIACDGQNFLVVWADFGSSGDLDVFGRLVTGQGQTPANIFAIAQGATIQKDPYLSFDGSRYLAVWLEDGNKILGQFIGTDGKLIAGPFPVSDTSSHERQYPGAAAIEGNYLAVWAEYHDGFDIYAALGSAINVLERGTDRIGGLSAAPNPFRSATRIRAGIGIESARLRGGLGLCIYDAAGRLVYSFAPRNTPCAFRWPSNGQTVPPGVYFVRSGDGRQVKLVKVK
jgi:hypothetical protein